MAGRTVAGGRTGAVVTLVVGLLVVVLAVVLTRGSGGASSPSVRATSSASVPSSTTPSGGATDPASGLRWVAESSLDGPTRRTLALIRAGGPFPYPRNDGVVYHNANHVLPREADGYYHEYTVPTPGSSTRGPRRVVTGSQGQLYLTLDHYDTFTRIRPSG
ncbi:ribonuclease domain-containing protein [Lapillicoccus jejuensis]|uniref:Guanyl-specific ribonuclease Sa n=1 Tax=Lapillicoccus jejuensis TaxID=402171 RepID=A0A542E3M2_9MICO|nr:ribonuclease domain-containing protein [Lapillicoccus jejuensis]TQJ09899.1 guanyl-specific ribonuclease Sa [Lapillicoccus jejuensis]